MEVLSPHLFVTKLKSTGQYQINCAVLMKMDAANNYRLAVDPMPDPSPPWPAPTVGQSAFREITANQRNTIVLNPGHTLPPAPTNFKFWVLFVEKIAPSSPYACDILEQTIIRGSSPSEAGIEILICELNAGTVRYRGRGGVTYSHADEESAGG